MKYVSFKSLQLHVRGDLPLRNVNFPGLDSRLESGISKASYKPSPETIGKPGETRSRLRTGVSNAFHNMKPHRRCPNQRKRGVNTTSHDTDLRNIAQPWWKLLQNTAKQRPNSLTHFKRPSIKPQTPKKTLFMSNVQTLYWGAGGACCPCGHCCGA